MKKEVKILSGLLLGIAAGAATGILLAPSSGKRTRKRIKKTANRMVEDAKDAVTGRVDQAVADINDSLDKYTPKRKSSMANILGS